MTHGRYLAAVRVAWATDIHLDFLADPQVLAFAATLATDHPDIVVLSGDLSHAELLEHHLRLLAQEIACPIYFVLGNHDYYGSSIAAVRQAVAELGARKTRLRWLPAHGVVALSEETAMVGVDGWADARLGDPQHTPVVLNDFIHIEDLVATLDPLVRATPGLLRTTDRLSLHAKLRALGDDEAAWREYDTCALLRAGARFPGPVLVDQGDADKFLADQLRPEALAQACADTHQSLRLRVQRGHDHSYFFIASFIGDHIAHHAEQLAR